MISAQGVPASPAVPGLMGWDKTMSLANDLVRGPAGSWGRSPAPYRVDGAGWGGRDDPPTAGAGEPPGVPPVPVNPGLTDSTGEPLGAGLPHCHSARHVVRLLDRSCALPDGSCALPERSGVCPIGQATARWVGQMSAARAERRWLGQSRSPANTTPALSAGGRAPARRTPATAARPSTPAWLPPAKSPTRHRPPGVICFTMCEGCWPQLHMACTYLRHAPSKCTRCVVEAKREAELEAKRGRGEQ